MIIGTLGGVEYLLGESDLIAVAAHPEDESYFEQTVANLFKIDGRDGQFQPP